ncbi:hypothetical protein GXW83_30660 [Streptacidiphilus sp. PB12-B1b]|uniref:hypothetical protein n=1 Tax=Streptacidiphilus sp. PB12-B1b TaxID=2705012 RepID=UPI0015F94FF7|nr:hypothetical protein [Streptacidiphilus sp. PB12-B1b]QMU79424.1 hypothetical protein GXW83_30660 [Streptacidiphilus sp. PB12-B1b]
MSSSRPGASDTGTLRDRCRRYVVRAADAEWGALFRAVRGALLRRRWAAVPLTLVATAAVLVFQVVQHSAGGAALVGRIGVVQASLPLWRELLRTPLSLFVPAPDLPVWGAAAQVFLVFGIAELALGRWRTLAVAYLGSLAGTLYARNGVRLGPGSPFGLPPVDALVRDTGPSAAVVALAVCVAWRYRAWVTGGAVVLGMVLEEALLPNLAGAEHLCAIACALAVSGYGEVVGWQWGRTASALRSVLAVGPLTEQVRRTSRAAAA